MIELRSLTDAELKEQLEEVKGKLDDILENISDDEPEDDSTEEKAGEGEPEEAEREEDIDALTERANELIELKEAIKTELEERAKVAATKAELRAKVAEDNTIEVKETHKEKEKMDRNEILRSTQYVNAFAEYIKSGDDTECRSLLTENATDGTIPVPELVEGIVNTAWNEEPLMQYVNKTFLKGNVKMGFEISATDAEIHAEGGDAPAEETLKLGIVTMVPETIKKWLTVSDESLDLNGAAFLEYIYREITHKITAKAAAIIVEKILAAPTEATATQASVATITATGTAADLIDAQAALSDEARNVIAVMSKSSEATLKKAALSANYAYDPFDGLTVVNSDAVGDSIIVGDFGTGITANFPNGYGVQFKYDDLSLAERDLVKIVGRMPMAAEVVACGRFCVIKAASNKAVKASK